MGDLRAINSQFLDAYQLKSMDTVIDSDLSRFEPFYRRADGKIALANVGGDQELLRTDDPGVFDFWDVVIRCTGWLMDAAPFAEGSHPETTNNGKYPKMSAAFESTNVPGLWFAGTLMHGNDWRKSSGGFIHGFRYLVRALGNILELQNEGVPWPSTAVSTHAQPITGTSRDDRSMRNYVEVATAILRRSSEMSGPYQMFSVLTDVYVFTTDGRCTRYDEVPADYVPTFLQRMSSFVSISHYIGVTFEYGEEYSGVGHDTFASSRVVRPFPLDASLGPGSTGNFIHPVLRLNCYSKSSCRTKKAKVYHVGEDVHTTYLRPVIDIGPLADHLFRHDVLRHAPVDPPEAGTPTDGASPGPSGRRLTRCAVAPISVFLATRLSVRQTWLSQV